LTGTPPFGGRPSMRVLFAHLQEPPPDISELRGDVSAATAKAVNRALEKEPEDRPSTAGAYVQSVSRAAGL
jgi:serine/threonine-protein kinase